MLVPVDRAAAADPAGIAGANDSASAFDQKWPALPALLRQVTDAAGLRSRLEQAGLKFTFTYYGDAFANPSGGVKQGLGYDGRLGAIVDADLQKLAGRSRAAPFMPAFSKFTAPSSAPPTWITSPW